MRIVNKKNTTLGPNLGLQGNRFQKLMNRHQTETLTREE